MAWHATTDVLCSPLHGSSNYYLIAAGIVSGIALSSTLDRPVQKNALMAHGSWVKTVDDIGHIYQMPFTTFGTASVLYTYGLLADNASTRRIGWEIVESYGIAGAGTQIVKHAVGRHRPDANDGPFIFSAVTTSNEHLSFPSGDVTAAFSFASVLAAETGTVPTTVLFYGLGALTAFQRWNKNQHWFSDTVGAAAWGTAVGLGVVHFNRLRAASSVNISVSAQPPTISLAVNL